PRSPPMVLSRVRPLLRALFRRAAVEREMDEELRFHLEMEAEKHRRAGIGTAEAMRRATLAFGGVERVREEMRDGRGTRWLHDLGWDVAFTLRSFWRRLGFTGTAVACLGVAVALNTGVFGILDALLWRDPPGISGRSRIASLHLFTRERDGMVLPTSFAPGEYEIVRATARAFSEVAAFSATEAAVATGAEARSARVAVASDNYFRALGTRPALGRTFAPPDEAASAEPVAVISHALWTERFRGRADALGRIVWINRRPFTVIGVAPPSFYGAALDEATLRASARTQLWVPLAHAAVLGFPARSANEAYLQLAGRLAPAASRRAAGDEGARIVALLRAAGTPTREAAALRVTPLGQGSGESPLLNALLVMAIPLAVLVIACGNLGVLLLAQATARAQELAVRTAVGATHGRILRQFMAESALVAVLAGVLGLVLSLWAVDLARAFALDLPVRPGLSAPVLLFTLALVAAATLVFGLVPAHRLARVEPFAALRAGGSGETPRASRLQAGVVVGQVALSSALLLTCALFVRGTGRGAGVPLGFERENLLVVSFDPAAAGVDSAAARALRRDALQRLRALGGVAAVGAADFRPLASLPDEHFATRPGGRDGTVKVVRADTGFFRAAGVPLRSRPGDQATAPGDGRGAVVVGDGFAAGAWAGASPVGRPLSIGPDTAARVATVAAVAGELVTELDREPPPLVYRLEAADALPYLYLRTAVPPASLRPAVRRTLAALAPGVPVEAWTGEQLLRGAIGPWQQLALGTAIFGGIALVLAGAGIHAVLSYLVTRRTREIGVRFALGARRGAVARMVVGRAVRLTALGIACGAPLGVAIAVLLRHLLLGLSPVDPLAFAGSSAFLLAAGAAAALGPALRAAAVDPMTALRQE
ncbi:MAG TPA: ABC transporter permease, partial [Longimicrobium sp.]|nr:ABC transporter permease [Longimicrobium sp.]